MHNSHDLGVKTKNYNWYFTSFDKGGIFCFLTPCLILVMLLITCCRLLIREMRFTRLHAWMLVIRVVGNVCVYAVLCPFDALLGEAIDDLRAGTDGRCRNGCHGDAGRECAMSGRLHVSEQFVRGNRVTRDFLPRGDPRGNVFRCIFVVVLPNDSGWENGIFHYAAG